MRLVHLTTNVKGGAGLAAFRFHKTMLDDGLNSVLYSKYYNNKALKCYKVDAIKEKNILKRIVNFFIYRITKLISLKYEKLNLEYQSGIKTQYRLDKCLNNGDVLIIHWVADFLDFKTFFNNIDKDLKVFVYVHDFNIILGRVHTLFDKKKVKSLLLKSVEKYYQLKKAFYYNKLNNLKIVANSNFTYNVLLEANVFKKQILSKVYLGVSKNELTTINKKRAKHFMGFNDKDFLILISSNDIEVERKGCDRFFKIINMFKDYNNIKFIGLGKIKNPKLLNHKQFFNFTTWDSYYKSNIFSGADVTLSTAYEETFGQTVIESYACSTPVIVYNNSALIELVEHNKTGFVAKSDRDVYNFINSLVKNSSLQHEMGKLGNKTFFKKFTSDIQLKEFKKLLVN